MAANDASIRGTPTADDAALKEVVRRLVEAYQPERIYLFGSVARGDAGPDSDFDLLVIVPDDAEPERRRSRLACQVLRGTGTAVDVVVWRRGRFERRATVVTSLPASVEREGLLLYDQECPGGLSSGSSQLHGVLPQSHGTSGRR